MRRRAPKPVGDDFVDLESPSEKSDRRTRSMKFDTKLRRKPKKSSGGFCCTLTFLCLLLFILLVIAVKTEHTKTLVSEQLGPDARQHMEMLDKHFDQTAGLLKEKIGEHYGKLEENLKDTFGDNFDKTTGLIKEKIEQHLAFLYRSGGAQHFLKTGLSQMGLGRSLSVATWNIAAINNNPFEYWITYKENPQYEELMVNVERFLESPGDKDVPVRRVFTEEMFEALDRRLTNLGSKSMRTYWDGEFKDRKIVEQFMKDKMIGSKRLASMPDRITNTINVEGGGQVYRPTVINMYDGDLSTMDKWWSSWEKFMFDDKLRIKGKGGTTEEKAPFEMLKPISREKYKDVSAQEEEDSLPLQTLCGAIFDAILVHMMNTVSDPDDWQNLKRTMVENLNKKKVPHTREILEKAYSSMDIITLQEVSGSFIEDVRSGKLGESFHVIAPAAIDTVRDQNSVILLSKSMFPGGATGEISGRVIDVFPADKRDTVADGDILAITATDKYSTAYVVASFHGDTNGLATKPVLDALVKTMKSDASLVQHNLIFGLDANVYEHASPKQQDVMDFGERYRHHGLTSCWGHVPQPNNYTTYNARTYLQPQLNKACKKSEKREKGDVNPKDFILFLEEQFEIVKTWKDNTGEKNYIEDMAFPTLSFPSDHGIVATVLKPTVSSS